MIYIYSLIIFYKTAQYTKKKHFKDQKNMYSVDDVFIPYDVIITSYSVQTNIKRTEEFLTESFMNFLPQTAQSVRLSLVKRSVLLSGRTRQFFQLFLFLASFQLARSFVNRCTCGLYTRVRQIKLKQCNVS